MADIQSSEITLTIRLQANRADLIIMRDGIGQIGQVEDYQQPSDLVPEIERLTGSCELEIRLWCD